VKTARSELRHRSFVSASNRLTARIRNQSRSGWSGNVIVHKLV
jgi:hypothetical protein